MNIKLSTSILVRGWQMTTAFAVRGEWFE